MSGYHADGQVAGAVAHRAVLADLHPHRVEVDDRVDGVERPARRMVESIRLLRITRHTAVKAPDAIGLHPPVRARDRGATERSLKALVVHMHIAWLYMLHARFLQRGVDFHYRKPNGHVEHNDGEAKTWKVARCGTTSSPRTTTPCGTTSSPPSACATRSSTASRSC